MKGFTLLEILIATALTAVILMAVYGAYTSNMETIQAARENARMHQTARILFDLMKKDLQCALAEDEIGILGEDRELDGKPADRLRIVTSASHAGAAGLNTGLYRISYEMVPDEKEEGYVLYRTQEGVVGEGASTGPQAYELTRRVSGLDLRFQDREGEMLESWGDQEGFPADQLPSLVLARVTLKTPSGLERVFTMAVHPELAGFQP